MRGFDDRWRDFPHWMLGITEEIWEGRGLGARMTDHYGAGCIVRTPMGVTTSERAMTDATLFTLSEFPDRQLLGEDVIWCGTPEDGMLSSHRNLGVATHRGGAFRAEDTGLPVRFRAIADCWAKDGQIHDEWLVRDNGALVRQLGMEPREWAEMALERGMTPYTPERDVTGPYTGKGDPGTWGALYAECLGRIMAADLAVIGERWDRACQLEYPGGVGGHGRRDADRFWLGLRAAFPSADFTIHHVIGREDAHMPPRAAIRWSLDGKHDGWGAFGRPSGRPVHVMGICHAEFGSLGGAEPELRREWVLYDETAIWMQILGGTS